MILFNPFKKYNEQVLLTLGLLATLTGILISVSGGIIQDGVFDLHYVDTDYFAYGITAVLNIIILTGIAYGCGKWINRKTRLIDILNVSMVSRIPVYLSMVLMQATPLRSITERVMSQMGDLSQVRHMQLASADLVILMLVSFLSLLLLAHFIILFVNGFRVAVHATRWQHFLYCALSLVIAEIVTKVIYSFIIL